MKLTQPIRWHGGKSYLADWILSNFPPRDTFHLYREPYAGGLSVLLHLDPEGLSEGVNDINGPLTNFWFVLSDLKYFVKFQRFIESTPFSEDTWEDSKECLDTFKYGHPRTEDHFVEWAVAFFTNARQSRQGLMKNFATPTTRIRRGMNENVSSWLTAVEGLADVHARLKRVEVRCMDALEFIEKYDHSQALYYTDPPYVLGTRSNNGGEYEHEMSNQQHSDLLYTLSQIRGRFLLSGYTCPLYEEASKKHMWNAVSKEIPNQASSALTKEMKKEYLWMNY